MSAHPRTWTVDGVEHTMEQLCARITAYSETTIRGALGRGCKTVEAIMFDLASREHNHRTSAVTNGRKGAKVSGMRGRVYGTPVHTRGGA